MGKKRRKIRKNLGKKGGKSGVGRDLGFLGCGEGIWGGKREFWGILGHLGDFAEQKSGKTRKKSGKKSGKNQEKSEKKWKKKGENPEWEFLGMWGRNLGLKNGNLGILGNSRGILRNENEKKNEKKN